MLYRGSEVVREVSLLVYDEIHYLRDKERGVVWEESIIMAPKTARFAFLSATIPNAKEFAMWIAKVGREGRRKRGWGLDAVKKGRRREGQYERQEHSTHMLDRKGSGLGALLAADTVQCGGGCSDAVV
eukprot:166103-Chlamydomonas_euryale.AAC.2